MVTPMDGSKVIRLTPTPEDARVIELLYARLGISGSALVRLCLREKALSLGIWAPPGESGPGEAEATTEATGTEG